MAVTALNPFRSYDTKLRLGLPATVVLDPLPEVELAQAIVDTMRRRVRQDTSATEAAVGNLSAASAGSCCTAPGAATRPCLLDSPQATPSGSAAAWIATHELRYVCGTADLVQARNRLSAPSTICADNPVLEPHHMARTIGAWQVLLLACLITDRAINSPTEAVNLLIKRIKRVGFGYRSFGNYRMRVLLHRGTTWQTHRTRESWTLAKPYVVGVIAVACRRAGVRLDAPCRNHSKIRTAVAAINNTTWTPIPNCPSHVDRDTGHVVDSRADVVVSTHNAIDASSHPVTARLAVRQVRRLRPRNGQLELDTDLWRHHTVLTDPPEPLLTVETEYRAHVVIETVIADLEHSAMTYHPSGTFNANAT